MFRIYFQRIRVKYLDLTAGKALSLVEISSRRFKPEKNDFRMDDRCSAAGPNYSSSSQRRDFCM